MPDELTTLEKVRIASEIGSDILVGILRRRAADNDMDIGTLLAESTKNSQDADVILDRLAEKGHETPTPNGEDVTIKED